MGVESGGIGAVLGIGTRLPWLPWLADGGGFSEVGETSKERRLASK